MSKLNRPTSAGFTKSDGVLKTIFWPSTAESGFWIMDTSTEKDVHIHSNRDMCYIGRNDVPNKKFCDLAFCVNSAGEAVFQYENSKGEKLQTVISPRIAYGMLNRFLEQTKKELEQLGLIQ